ncbi:hypothetical protein H6F89_31390 [Cyanobacteria bacterium FACHB-63]|nr:hypothetical protein [Cyanobacteria bacterium FACHB-63]
MKSKLLLLITSSLFTALFATEVLANPYPIVSRRSAEEKICFMHQNGISLDLSLLCGEVFDDVASNGIVGTVGAGASGRCDSPGQIAANGSRCGNRAASVRPGGRLGGSLGGGQSGSRSSGWVRGYTRSDGTTVRGHYRSVGRASGFGSGRSGAGA